MPSSVSPRRFPPPWTIDEANSACFIVRDSMSRRDDQRMNAAASPM